MDNTSDKKPLLSSNSSRASGEGSNSKKDSKKETKTQSKKESKRESKRESKKETQRDSKESKGTPPVSGDHKGKEASPTPHRIVRPTAQARPFSTRTKGLYWALTIIHLILLLCILFALSFGLLQFVFAQTREGPLYWGQGSFIGGVPAIMHEPVKKDMTKNKGEEKRNRITFSPNDTESFDGYVKRLKDVMTVNRTDEVDGQKGVTKCDRGSKMDSIWKGDRTGDYCLQDHVDHLPSNDSVCSHSSSEFMGYDKGTPCILIRLTKLLGFFPTSDKQEAEDGLFNTNSSSCDEKIPFQCTGKHRGNGTEVSILVPDGIPFCRFPYWNQKGYEAPYIMIRPLKPLPAGETKITCLPKMKTLKKLSDGRDNKIDIVVTIEQKEKKTGQTA